MSMGNGNSKTLDEVPSLKEHFFTHLKDIFFTETI